MACGWPCRTPQQLAYENPGTQNSRKQLLFKRLWRFKQNVLNHGARMFRGLFQLEKSLSPIDRKWLYVINLNFFVWRHECHRFLLKFWLKQIFSCLTPNWNSPLVFSHTVSLRCRKQGTQLGLNHWDLGDVREVENVVTAYWVCMWLWWYRGVILDDTKNTARLIINKIHSCKHFGILNLSFSTFPHQVI